jgi:hypothetical protein
MGFFKTQEIPEFLRPFFPFLVEDDSDFQLVLNREDSPRKYGLLIVALINLVCSVAFSSILYFTGFIVFVISFILYVVEEGYKEITVTTSGINMVRKCLIFKTKRYLSKGEIHSIECFLKTINEESSYGRIMIRQTNGRKRKILELSRERKNELIEDMNAITMKISQHIFVPVDTRTK